MFRVHIGYTRTGRNRWRRFATLEAATAFCQAVHKATRIVLAIERSVR